MLDHLRTGRTLTQVEALATYGIGRLAARVGELRDAGHDVRTKMERVRKADGSTANIARYLLGGD